MTCVGFRGMAWNRYSFGSVRNSCYSQIVDIHIYIYVFQFHNDTFTYSRETHFKG